MMSPIKFLAVMLMALLPVAASAEVYELPPEGSGVVGAVGSIRARQDDTLIDIARRHGLGYEDIVRANPEVDTWLPGEGTQIVLPTRFVLPPGPRSGLVLNLAEYRMYYYPPPQEGKPAVVMTYPMSIGRMDWETPLGLTRIIAKVTNPSWYPPASVRKEHAEAGDPLPRIVPAGPDNPLGAYAMRLDMPSYLIHSTNKPAGVGMRVSHGCIRMLPEDIGFLFGQIANKTAVRIINEPIKFGWDGDELVLEVHRPLEVAPVVEESLDDSQAVAEISAMEEQQLEIAAEADPFALVTKDNMTAVTEQFIAATNSRPGRLDWDRVEMLVERADGIPVAVGSRIKNAATSAALK
jgi:L,D-transpeptidase ErfK/SrfK